MLILLLSEAKTFFEVTSHKFANLHRSFPHTVLLQFLWTLMRQKTNSIDSQKKLSECVA